MVAIDEDGKPAKVPELIIESEQEKINYEAALKRKEYRKLRADENF